MSKNFYFWIFLLFFIGCKKNQDLVLPEGVSEMDISGCYIYSQDSNYVEMEIINEGEEIIGKLKYALFEKDANTGTIKGRISKGILIADYRFTSEGVQSTRQIAFLIKNNQLIEGYGEVEVNGKTANFKNIENLNFSSSNIVLEKQECSIL